jgi:hypothetical protein
VQITVFATLPGSFWFQSTATADLPNRQNLELGIAVLAMQVSVVLRTKYGGAVVALHTSRWAMLEFKVLTQLQIENQNERTIYGHKSTTP